MQIKFLTRIPVPVNIKFDEKDFAKGVIFFPFIGLIIGCILGGIYFISGFLNNRVISAFFVVLGEIIITGSLHLDGLADTFDGLFSYRPKKKILEIMKDSQIGIYGTISLILVIIFKIILLCYLPAKLIIQYIVLMPVFSRLNIVWCAGISDYARKEKGIGKSVIENTGIKEIFITTFISIIIGMILLFIKSFILIIVSIFFAVGFTLYVKKKINGTTGDVLGAVVELSEVVILFTAFLLEFKY